MKKKNLTIKKTSLKGDIKNQAKILSKSKSVNKPTTKIVNKSRPTIKLMAGAQSRAEVKTWPENRVELKNFVIGSGVSFVALIALIFLASFFCQSTISLIKGEKFNYFPDKVINLNMVERLDRLEDVNEAQELEDAEDFDEVERLSNLIYFGEEEAGELNEEDSKSKNEDILDKDNKLNLDNEDYSNQGFLSEDIIIEESEFMTLPDGGSGFESLNFLNSADGSKFAFIVKEDGKEAVLLNGDLGPFYDRITFMAFSPDSRRFVYGARVGSDEMVVLDGLPGPIYDWVLLPRFFSPDSRYFIYKARTDEGDFLVFNETEGKIYEQIYQPFVNSDNSALIFYSRNGQQIYKNILKLSSKN